MLSFLVEQAGLDGARGVFDFQHGIRLCPLLRARCWARRSWRSRERLGLSALVAGRVEEGPRQVILEPVDVRFAGEELELS